MTIRPSFLFDLDGTLVDSVYEHVLAWQEALTAEGIELSVWRIHRKIGMSGGLFTNQLLRETKMDITPDRVERLGRPGPVRCRRGQVKCPDYQLYRGRGQYLGHARRAPLPGARGGAVVRRLRLGRAGARRGLPGV